MSCLDFAKLYITKYRFAVFPVHFIREDSQCSCGRGDACRSPGKHPLTGDGFKAATLDAAQIERWWTAHPQANIGIATGKISNIAVLDVDPRHGGFDSLAKLAVPQLETTMKCRTGGGGEHYYFRYPENAEIKNSAGKLGAGLDVRGEGGYVVAPPSNHTMGVYQWDRWEELAEWPFSSSAPVPGAVPDASRFRLLAGRQQDCRRDAGATIGTRNATLASLAGTMRRRGFSQNAITQALLIENQSRCEPPLENVEVRDIAVSIARYESSAGGSAEVGAASRRSSSNNASADGNERRGRDAHETAGETPALQAWNLSEFLSHTFPAKDTICFEAGRGDVAMVSARTNGGKSTLLRNCLLKLAIGRPFPPFVPEGQRPRRVMLLDFETDAADLQRDLATMTQDFSAIDHEFLGDNFMVVPRSLIKGNLFQLNEHFDVTYDLITANRSEVLVVDNVSAAFQLIDENSNAEVNRRVLKPLTNLALVTGAAIIFAHHIGKTGEGSREDVYQSRGASSLSCNVRSVFNLKGRVDEGEPTRITCVKQKSGQNFAANFRLDAETRWFTPEENSPAAPVRRRTNYDLIVEWVRENSSPEKPVKTSEIIEAFPQISRTMVTVHLRDAVIRGEVISPVRGSYSRSEKDTEVC